MKITIEGSPEEIEKTLHAVGVSIKCPLKLDSKKLASQICASLQAGTRPYLR